MKTFTNTAQVIRYHRRILGISQAQLGSILYPGARNGQFISAIERGRAGLPGKHIEVVCRTLGIEEKKLKEAMMMDYESNLLRSEK
jgi:ribosome-binding protein aMBF1 (putative translation factor)